MLAPVPEHPVWMVRGNNCFGKQPTESTPRHVAKAMRRACCQRLQGLLVGELSTALFGWESKDQVAKA